MREKTSNSVEGEAEYEKLFSDAAKTPYAPIDPAILIGQTMGYMTACAALSLSLPFWMMSGNYRST